MKTFTFAITIQVQVKAETKAEARRQVLDDARSIKMNHRPEADGSYGTATSYKLSPGVEIKRKTRA